MRRAARLFGEGQGGLVAVMAVGDEELQRRQRPRDGARQCAPRQNPKPLCKAFRIGKGDVGWTLGCLGQQPPQLAAGAVVDEPQRLQARARRAHQLEAILLGTAVRALVRQDDASLVWLEPQRGNQVAAGAPVTQVHLVHVHRRVVHMQRSVLQPALEGPGRAVVVGARTDEADDVVR